ncbi:hypothetical protein B0H10DRAFT_704360 [Mycena sp. CBHHK59/15]|nr:hypothetical protein B0H10DRAFT_704360 [Mycena sp. CBHHK59/15]
MKISVALTALFFGSLVAADSGIFADDGSVLSAPTVVERSAEARSFQVGHLQKKETNSDRMRRGLPPLPPTRIRSALEDRLQPRTSPIPCSPLSNTLGYVQVTKSDGTAAGYISKTFDDQRSYTLTTSLSAALQVILPSLSPFDGPIDILASNGPDAAHPYLGAVGGSGGYTFGPGIGGYSYMSGTGASSPNSPPSSSAGTSIQSLGYNAPSESQIWSIDCLTRQISAQWTNTDSSQPATSLFYDPLVDFLGLTSDLDTFNDDFVDEGAYAVTFTFVPL